MKIGRKERFQLDLQGHFGFVDGRKFSIGPGLDFIFGRYTSNNRFVAGGYVFWDFVLPVNHIAYRRYFLARKLYIDLNLAVYYTAVQNSLNLSDNLPYREFNRYFYQVLNVTPSGF